MTTIHSPTETQTLSIEQYRARPEGSPKCEFELGELIPMTQPTPQHQDTLLVLCYALRNYVRRNQLGRVFMTPDVRLSDTEWYIPDIAYLSNACMN